MSYVVQALKNLTNILEVILVSFILSNFLTEHTFPFAWS